MRYYRALAYSQELHIEDIQQLLLLFQYSLYSEYQMDDTGVSFL